MSFFLQCAYDFGWLVLGAVAMIAVLKVVGRLLGYLWLPEAARAAVERGGPLIGVVAVLSYVSFGFLVIFEREQDFAWVILGVTLLFIAFAWSPMYDLICGVAFKASRVCRVGDHICVGEVEGRVVRVGARVLVVRTRSGDEAVLYYGRIVRDAFRRTQSLVGAHVHSFVVDAPPPEELADIPTVCGSLREALEELEADMDFLLAGDVFNRDQLEAYMELKWEEIYAYEHTPHPMEFKLYYGV